MNVFRLLLPLAFASTAFAEPAMTDRITPEQLAAKSQPSPLLSLPQLKDPDEAKVKSAAGESILDQSDILTDGTHWTFVPKGALLHIPAAMASRVGAKPAGQLLVWSEFLTANPSWISAEEVTYEQACGKKQLSADHMNFWPKQGKVIVAVHLGGPISVRPPAANAQPTR